MTDRSKPKGFPSSSWYTPAAAAAASSSPSPSSSSSLHSRTASTSKVVSSRSTATSSRSATSSSRSTASGSTSRSTTGSSKSTAGSNSSSSKSNINANSYPPRSSTSSSSTSSSSSSSRAYGVSSTTKLPSKPPPTLPPLPPPPPVTLKHLPPPAPLNRPKPQHLTAADIRKAFQNYMQDPALLDKAADYLYDSLLEDAVMGVYLEVHQSIKSGALEALEGQCEDDSAFKMVESPNYDVFGMNKPRKPIDFNCPNCDRMVAAVRFAPHLEKCMGMGRKKSRMASRRIASAKETNTTYFASVAVSDDDDDLDWSAEKRRKKTSRTNGSRKNGRSSY